ncbi:hypothetical protein EDD27_8072 [Nonomuraea polychroma]|uniref:Uncharacterized protein n=1 Tax=Nonomuraea polychroma TaxID=46176 RepID=A0A438MHN7_9ACTN|nr:hypothetical protein [Nonomuraea polychroma]RVX45284.1 hypothetical protein EDD27_8072 [Nonomuraea polychroma]
MRSMRRIGSLAAIAAIAVSVALLGSPASANVGEISKEAVVLRVAAQDGGPRNSGEISDDLIA